MVRQAGNKETMKMENRRQVIRLIREAGQISRIQLARETRLTQSAIGTIIGELVKAGLAVETGKQNDMGLGRKPILLEINPGWGYVAAVSLDREETLVGLLNMNGRPVGETVRLEYSGDVPRTLDEIAIQVRRLVEKSGISESRIIGLGVTAPGPVDSARGVILNPPGLGNWHGCRLREELEARLPYGVYVEHNSHALARAVKDMGNGRRYSSFALLVINAGIGLGLVLGGELYTGANGSGCELGHTSVDIHGRPCGCGNQGCLELYASTAAVIHDANRVRPDLRSWESLVDQAIAGDAFCDGLLERQARYLSQSIINLNNLLELEAVIITGQAAYRGERLVEKIEGYVHKSVLSKSLRSLRIELSELTEHPQLAAAAAVVVDDLQNGDLYARVMSQRAAGEENRTD